MFRWGAYPFVRLALYFAIGIVGVDLFNPIPLPYLIIGLILLLISLVLVWRIYHGGFIFGIFLMVLFGFIGALYTHLSDSTIHKDHLLNNEQIVGIVGTVKEPPVSRGDWNRHLIDIEWVIADDTLQKASGCLYLYVNDSSYQMGDKLWVHHQVFGIPAPQNPDVFDYQTYLKHQGIYGQIFCSSLQITKLGLNQKRNLWYWSQVLRGQAEKSIEQTITSPREAAIFKALLLGLKDDLDADTKVHYANSGSMHVLAVSGLHVGILYVLLGVLFAPWKSRRLGSILMGICSLAIIWAYALVTGFTPSVFRAATMFSVVIISDWVGRKPNIYNSLGLAALVLMLHDPWTIFSVGFQLSFAAVLSIVALHDRFVRIWEPPSRFLSYIWTLTVVSIAAQIGTLPLVIYYFHQIPTYSLLANLVVIPGATVLLTGGLFMLGLTPIFGGVALWIGKLLTWISFGINETIMWIANLPHPVLDWIYLDFYSLLLCYLFLIFLGMALFQYDYNLLVGAACLGILFLGWNHQVSWNQINQKQMVFYDLSKGLFIDLIQGNNARLIYRIDGVLSSSDLDYQINPHRLQAGLRPAQSSLLSWGSSSLFAQASGYSYMSWQNQWIVLPDSASHLALDSAWNQPVYIYINDDITSIESLRQGTLVLGHQVRPKREAYWRERLKNFPVRIHALRSSGALVINL